VVPVRIENRAQLIYLLTEAAELEHAIMCCYLFANFTLKNDTSEGITSNQLASIRNWRQLIREVSVQEMVHLGSVCNLLTAIGGAPQLRRPNLPTRPKAYGSTFQLRLAPFGIEALQQFIDIELPMSLMPPEPPDSGDPLAIRNLSDVFSSEREYSTQGTLYRGIEDGFKYLAQKYGEDQLFIGRQEAQTADGFFRLPGLIPVHDLDSALEAVNIIVEQGEGASEDSVDSHYHKFKQIFDEYEAILLEQPDFAPARPVLSNPYAIMPSDLAGSSDINILDNPFARDVCSLFDGCYELMVQILGRLFIHAEETEAELQDLSQTSVRMMLEVLEPLGSAITLLPAGPAFPNMNAGPGFRLTRGAMIPTSTATARLIFSERLSELASYARLLRAEKAAPAALGNISAALSSLADTFGA
jgi:hypothetical protein